MHDGQLTVPVGAVRALVDEQFPQWRGLPVKDVESEGTVNAIFRIGDQLAARFPLQPDDPGSVRKWLESEAAAARELAGVTRFATPRPVAIGEPGRGYPLAWSVQTWLTGVVASDDDPGWSVAFAHDLAEFIAGVRSIETRSRYLAAGAAGVT